MIILFHASKAEVLIFIYIISSSNLFISRDTLHTYARHQDLHQVLMSFKVHILT